MLLEEFLLKNVVSDGRRWYRKWNIFIAWWCPLVMVTMKIRLKMQNVGILYVLCCMTSFRLPEKRGLGWKHIIVQYTQT